MENPFKWRHYECTVQKHQHIKSSVHIAWRVSHENKSSKVRLLCNQKEDDFVVVREISAY